MNFLISSSWHFRIFIWAAVSSAGIASVGIVGNSFNFFLIVSRISFGVCFNIAEGFSPSASDRFFQPPFFGPSLGEGTAVVVPMASRTRHVVLMVEMLPVVTQRKRKAAAMTTNQNAIWVRARLSGSTP